LIKKKDMILHSIATAKVINQWSRF